MVLFPLFRPEHRSFWRDQPDRGSGRDAVRFRRAKDSPSENPRQKREAQDKSAGWPICMHRTHRARYKEVPSEQGGMPGRLFFRYYLLATHKFVWSEFEQPIGWPEGRKPRTVFVAKVSRLSVREPTYKPVASATHKAIPDESPVVNQSGIPPTAHERSDSPLSPTPRQPCPTQKPLSPNN